MQTMASKAAVGLEMGNELVSAYLHYDFVSLNPK